VTTLKQGKKRIPWLKLARGVGKEGTETPKTKDKMIPTKGKAPMKKKKRKKA
jgi:hypothetical protein